MASLARKSAAPPLQRVRRKKPEPGPIASAVAASAEGLEPTDIGPKPTVIDLDAIGDVLSEPAWSNVGIYLRTSYAMLLHASKGGDTKASISELLADNDSSFEDILDGIGRTRIALLSIAAMMTVSLRKQWKAIDALLVESGLTPTDRDDEFCDDDHLLALRAAFEAGRARMKATTDIVAKVEPGRSDDDSELAAAYAKQGEAVDADRKVALQVAALRARTKEGIQLKREVRAYWADCELPELDASIFADLLAYVETSP